MKKGLVGQVIDSGRLLRQDENSSNGNSAEFGHFEGICQQHKLSNQLVIPLKQGARKIGAVLFAADSDHPYDEEDEQVGVLLSSGLAGNLEMARLYQQRCRNSFSNWKHKESILTCRTAQWKEKNSTWISSKDENGQIINLRD